jgi:hypothetical protein
MTAASVNIKEIDKSTRVPSFPGVTGAMLIPALKGPVSEPSFVTSDSQLLERFTPNATVEVGMSLAFYSALAYLEKSDKLWVVRTAKDALYGGASLKAVGSVGSSNQSFSAGLADPTAYVFDGLPDVEGVAEVTEFDFTGVAGATLDVSGAAEYVTLSAGGDTTTYYAWFNVTDGANTQNDPAPGGTGLQVDVLIGDNEDAIATKFDAVVAANADFTGGDVTGPVANITCAAEGDTTDATAGTVTGASVTVSTDGVDEVDQTDECVALFGNSQGAYNNSIGVKIITDPLIVKESDSFIIQVFLSSNTSTPIETHTVSRIPGKKDGFGLNIYIEDVLQASNYISGMSNPAIADTVLPQAQSTILYLAGGDDGTAVGDTEQVAALDLLSNPDDIFFTVLMDGGWASAAFGVAADTLVSSRQDSVAINSVPFSREAAADYITQILDYRNTTLNLNSSYSTLYSPHVQIQDKFNDRKLWVAPDGYAGGAISASASNFEIWYPPAGNTRGVLNVLDLRRRFTKGEQDILTDAQINPIRFTPGKGIRIWGQSTLRSTPSKLQELNVRLLLISVEPAIAEALENFLFDLNDESTRAQAKGILDTFMEDIEARRGVSAFQVVSDSSNNSDQDVASGRMVIDLYMIPTGATTTIEARVIVTNEGVDFSTINV